MLYKFYININNMLVPLNVVIDYVFIKKIQIKVNFFSFHKSTRYVFTKSK